MNRRERLRDSYEDALFALLMEDVIEEEGKQLREENERLKNDPEAAIPDAVDKRCLKTIKRSFAKEQYKAAGTVVYRTFSKVAVVAVLCAMLFAVAYAASPELRTETLNFLIEVSDVATNLTMAGDHSHNAVETSSTSDNKVLMGYRIPDVPDGFLLNEEMSGYMNSSAWLYYENEEGATICFDFTRTKGSPLTVDTEDANVETVYIHGYEGLLIEKCYKIEGMIINSIIIVWGDTSEDTFCTVDCTELDKEAVLALAEGVVFIGQNG